MFFKPEDFAKQWQEQARQWQEQMEKIFIEKINEMIRNPALLSAVGKSIETSFDSKRKADETIIEFLQKLNVPTRKDTARIMQYLQQVEARVLDIDEKIDQLYDRLSELKSATELLAKEADKPVTKARTEKTASKKTVTPKSRSKGRK